MNSLKSNQEKLPENEVPKTQAINKSAKSFAPNSKINNKKIKIYDGKIPEINIRSGIFTEIKKQKQKSQFMQTHTGNFYNKLETNIIFDKNGKSNSQKCKKLGKKEEVLEQSDEASLIAEEHSDQCNRI